MSQVLLSDVHHPNAMTNWVKSKSATTYKCHIQVVGDLLDYLMACKDMSWSLIIGWSWANQGISLADLIHLGAYELIELDIYTMLLAIRCLNG